MSTANTKAAIDPSGIEISNHAQLRVMQRLGVIERATQYVRELLEDARLDATEDVPGAQAWRVGDVVVVVDPHNEVVQTVFERPEGEP